MELEVKDLMAAQNYNRLLILTGTDLTKEVRKQFALDAHQNGINYLIVENSVQVKQLGFDLEIGSVLRYYAVVKGVVVGMETGYRTGDAIRILCGFGLRQENLGGEL